MLLATAAFQRLGHAWPFYLAGACVSVVGILAFQMKPPSLSVSAELAEEEAGAR